MNLFIELSLIIIIVLGVSALMRVLKQPLIIGYILAGILVGPLFLDILHTETTWQIFAEIGIAFLLFLVGLHLNPKVIKEVGKISLITGIGQIIFTSLIGYLICIALGFPPLTSLYIAIALTFSSTIIIMKLLSDKESLDKLYGKISVGFLLIQDLIAIIVLIFISSFASGEGSWMVVLGVFLKGIVLFVVLYLISHFLLPKLTNFFSRSQEFLFIFAIAWGFGISALFMYIGLSIEVGALLAGVLLSVFSYSHEISSKLKPLRDFFILAFFILLGSQMFFGNFSEMILPAIVLSLFILIGNPLIVLAIMGISGYSKNTGFNAGLTVAQISEFSLILVALGVRVGHLSNEVLSFVTIIGLFTIAGSTYMIMYSEKIFSYISKHLSIFERKNIKEKKALEKSYEYFLFGENRIGFSIMKKFINMKKDYLIIDFNPKRVKKLVDKNINCIYGDLSNVDLLEDIKLGKSKLVVSTIPDKEVNLTLLNHVRSENKKTKVIVTARQIKDAFDLYEAGADYVILPHFLGGAYVSRIIEHAEKDKRVYKKEKEKQIKDLKERLGEGHEHPHIERDHN